MKKRTQLKKLYLDDIRNPKSDGWEVVRSYDEFVVWITENGLPDEISFDHDLSLEHYGLTSKTDFLTFKEYYETEDRELTGYDAAKWLCEYCWTNGLPIPTWNVHSANPVGRDNIIQILKNYEKKLNN